jgi:Membrane iron-sulfur containing protein FtrD-like/Secretion system C-terminal sorting domain
MKRNSTNGNNAFSLKGSRGSIIARLLVVLFVLSCTTWETEAQTVTHPLSEISTSAKHFSYTHMLSATEKKELRYIIVEASDGDIKTVFDACDVCYLSDKGYSQSGSIVRCNNCGNRFLIIDLGENNTNGTCNPGYLPRTIEGGNVVIQVSDLVKGEYYFPLEIVTGIDDMLQAPEDIMLTQNQQQLTVTLTADGQRSFHIYSISGKHVQSFSNGSRIVNIDIHDFTAGSYVLAIEEAKSLTTKMFLVY